MNQQEESYFEALSKQRREALKFYQSPMDKGVFEIVQNLYKDKAHFVYELLQNADDQGATATRFVLTHDSLIFAHNAPRHFSITDPETHEEDQKAGRLGDINSIVSIGSSAKRGRDDDRVPIGKFGIGFKSVFQYTSRPEIYDDGVRFSIQDYILPELIDDDYPDRKIGETLFRFPFNKENRDKAYGEILETLERLANVKPLLFLNSLNRIEWNTESKSGCYVLSELGVKGSGNDINYETIVDGLTTSSHFWKFDRQLEGNKNLKVSVVFPINDEKRRLDDSYSCNLYCYLPTADKCPIPAILHAPFQLSNNRESIEVDNEHNNHMIQLLSALLSQSLEEICRLGERENEPWIDDNITAFIFSSQGQESNATTGSLDLNILSSKVLDAIHDGRMLWCEQRRTYLPVGQSAVPDAEYLPDVYPSEILSELFDRDYGWVLTSLKTRIKADAQIVKALGVERITNQKILDNISGSFLDNRDEAWLCNWYPRLMDVRNLWADLRYKEIILTSDGTFKAPFVKGKTDSNVHLHTEDELINIEGADVGFVSQSLLENEGCLEFFRGIGLTQVSPLTMAESVYLPKALKEVQHDIPASLNAIEAFAKIYNDKLSEPQKKTFENLPICPVIKDGILSFLKFSEIKAHTPQNDFFFGGNPTVPFFDSATLQPFLDAERIAEIEKMVRSSKKTAEPQIIEKIIRIDSQNQTRIPKDARIPAWYNRYNQKGTEYEHFREFEIEGLEYFCANIASENISWSSEIIMNLIRRMKGKGGCLYRSCYGGCWYEYHEEPLFYTTLRNSTWINVASKELKKELGLPVEEISADELQKVGEFLSSSGVVSSDQVSSLLEYIKNSNVLEEFRLEKEIEEQKKIVESVNQFTIEWLDEILNLRLKYVEAGKKDDITILINRLKGAINTLNISRDSDLRTILPDNIEVLFGPPGTGKTTYIAETVASELKNNSNAQILILTPTHQAADVVAEKINKTGYYAKRAINTNSSYNADRIAEIETKGIEVTNGCEEEDANVLATTVHYFSDPLCELHDHAWDMIIIDEASMVTLDYALLALIKGMENNPGCRFLISGDPLQLPAITNLDPFILEKADLDEFNFFSFIGLKEFSDDVSRLSESVNGKIKIKLLRKQYRSVKSLALLTGKLAYDNQIVPQRGDETKVIIPKGSLPIFRQPLSFVRFPISNKSPRISDEFPSITELDRLRGSNYNIYSALLVLESIKHLIAQYVQQGESTSLKIGIITPYVGQKLLLKELVNKDGMKRPAGIEIEVNTVHQFQGDEFDIVMLVLNPPNCSMSPANGIMINKFYLMNVATSRAKDCLVVLYPDETSCKAPQNFWYVNNNSDKTNIENIAEEIFGKSVKELTYHSSQIEELLFGSPDYLINNSTVEYRNDVNLYHYDYGKRYRFYKGKGGDSVDIVTDYGS